MTNSKLRKSAARTLALSGALHDTDFNYRTFIPWKAISDGGNDRDQLVTRGCLALAKFRGWVPNDLDTKTATFAGDGRTFNDAPPLDPAVRDYRTMVNLHFDWDSGTMTSIRRTGYTHVVSISDPTSIISTRHASRDGIKVTALPGSSDSYAQFNIDHTANDPFCPHAADYGTIHYNVNVGLSRQGVVTLTGHRFTMPSHEAWVRWNGAAHWSNVFTGNASELACLVAGAKFDWVLLPQAANPGTLDIVHCAQDVTARTAISNKRYTATDGVVSVTDRGQIWGSGPATLFPQYADGSSYCSIGSFVRSSYRFPKNVTITKLIADQNIALGSDHKLHFINSDGVMDGSFRDAASTGRTAWALTTTGDVVAWGWNPDYSSYRVDPVPRYLNSPTTLFAGHNIVKFTVGTDDVLALDSDGKIWHRVRSLEENDRGVNEYWAWVKLNTPSDVRFTDIAQVYYGGLALATTGQLWSWGNSPLASAASTDEDTGAPVPGAVEGESRFSSLSQDFSGIVGVDRDSGDSVILDADADTPYVDQLPRYDTPNGLTVNGRSGIDDIGEVWSLADDPNHLPWDPEAEPPVWTNLGFPPSTNPFTADNVSYTCAYPS